MVGIFRGLVLVQVHDTRCADLGMVKGFGSNQAAADDLGQSRYFAALFDASGDVCVVLDAWRAVRGRHFGREPGVAAIPKHHGLWDGWVCLYG